MFQSPVSQMVMMCFVMCLSAGACNDIRQSFVIKQLGKTARSVLVRSVFVTCHFAVSTNTCNSFIRHWLPHIESAQSLNAVAQH